MQMLGDAESRAAGRYRLIAELGRGGMGRVLLGAGPDGRLVAVKQIHPQFVADGGFTARFRREVAASRTVSGAYTAAVVDADVDGTPPWLASVFVPGPSLDLVGVLTEPHLLRLAAGLASALIEIHGAGLVHRDLKPSNVLLTADGLRVIDFGIARALDGDTTQVTGTGWLIGSPEYMSPEQVEGADLTGASDVFTLGSLLVKACTGTSPFVGPSTPSTLYNLVHTEPDLAALPTSVRRIAGLCLAKKPADRPGPAELLAEIGDIAPSLTPWPPAVHRMIESQHAEVVALLDGGDNDDDTPPARTTALVPEPPTVAVPPTLAVETGTIARPRRRWLRPTVAATVVAAAVAGLVVWSPWSSDRPQRAGLEPFNDYGASITTLTYSPDGEILASVGYGGEVHLWNAADGQQLGDQLPGWAVDVTFSPDGDTLAMGGRDDDEDGGRYVRLVDVATREQTGEITVPDGVSWVLFSPDGERLATQSEGEVRVWNVASGQETARLDPQDTLEFTRIAFSPDGTLLATSSLDEAIRLWDPATGQQSGAPLADDCTEGGASLAFSPDGRTLAVGQCHTATLWDVTDRTPTEVSFRVVEEEQFSVWLLAFTHDGTALATVGDVLQVWDIADRSELPRPATTSVSAMAVSPDGPVAVAESNEHVWLYRFPA